MIFSFGKQKIKGFTLLEILIVVVVLGVLIAALAPRIGQSQARAHDVRRKADLQEVALALMKYKLDYKTFPPGIGGLDVISGALKSAGMEKIPKDPIKNRVIGKNDILDSNYTGVLISTGQYGYLPLKKNGIENQGFLLMAATETEGGSNRSSNSLYYGGGFSPNESPSEVISALANNFIYDKNYDQNADFSGSISTYFYGNKDWLRYIYVY